MVSSTFTDLENHRAKVIEAIEKLGFKAEVMEFSGAQAEANVIEASLKMVENAAAYIGLVSHKYGQTPKDPDQNPQQLSITELEFNRAVELKRPILLFIMGDQHPVPRGDIDYDPERNQKLAAFRDRAKKMREGSDVERVYEVFDSVDDLAVRAATAIGRLAAFLETHDKNPEADTDQHVSAETFVARPLLAVPRYLGSHDFVGRAAELAALSDWCSEADPHPMLLFEAMGGQGKSMLTWEWLTKHATSYRTDWTGRFWYSFYESGAVMSSFCQHALAYMTGKPLDHFNKMKMPELSDWLIAELEARPWLMVLDGLERILVAYHRIDAAQLRDEYVDNATDQIARRDPRDAIGPQDDDLLRLLAVAAPSKILVSTRLTPRALLNNAGVPRPGVRREFLRGLRPSDAEAMIRSCGVRGDGKAIRAFLQANCDCHPLVVGALAGLINDYLPDQGNFDRWVDDATGGRALNLAELDLMQRKNNIVAAAIDVLEHESLQLLQTLSLLEAGADYETLLALNPHLPPEQVADAAPNGSTSSRLDDNARAASGSAAANLARTIRDLEKRGLLQYDGNEKRYDLHPVIRGVTSGRMGRGAVLDLGRKVVDHLTGAQSGAWDEAETLADLAQGLQVVRVLVRIGRNDQAMDVFGNVFSALFFKLNAMQKAQEICKAFFPMDWNSEPIFDDNRKLARLLLMSSLSLCQTDFNNAESLSNRAISLELSRDSEQIGIFMLAFQYNHFSNEFALCNRINDIWLSLSSHSTNKNDLFYTNYFKALLEIRANVFVSQTSIVKICDKESDEENFFLRFFLDIRKFYLGQSMGDFYSSELESVGSFKIRFFEIWQLRLRGQYYLDRSEPSGLSMTEDSLGMGGEL
jgi:hypothetical protein